MLSICSPSPLPVSEDIFSQFAVATTFPPSILTLPQLLPTLPAGMFGSLNSPNIALATTATEMQLLQLVTTVLAMIEPMIGLVGGSIESFLPTIPGLPGFNLLSLLSGEASELIVAVEAAVSSGFPFPIPTLYPGVIAPRVATIHTMQLIVRQYMMTVIEAVIGLIGSVTSILEISGMPTPPAFPTIPAILSAIQTGNPIAGFPFPGLPTPLIPSINSPVINTVFTLIAFYTAILLIVLTPIFSFVTGTLASFLSFTFPLMCISL